MKHKNSSNLLRIVSLTGFFTFLTWTAYMHQIKGGGAAGVPAIDSLCPFGGLETLYRWIGNGEFLRRTAPSAIILFVTVGVSTLLLGRTFCGWICPLGAMGEFSAFVGRKLHLPKLTLPENVDKRLKMLKYVVLLGILWGTVSFGTLIWRDYDPWVAWAHLSAGLSEAMARPWSYVLLFGTVIGASFFIERFWCRYLCPLGAALGIAGKISPLKVGSTDESSCTQCGLCSRACPVQLKPEKGPVSQAECLVCGKCVDAALPSCHVQFRFAGKGVRVLTAGIVTLVLFFGGYATARSLGIWKTFVPPKVSTGMTPQQIADSVFGWMSLKQASELTGIPVEVIKEKAKLDKNTPENESMKKLGINDEKVKEAIKEIAMKFSANTASAPEKETAAHREAPASLPFINPSEIKGTATLLELQAAYGLEPSAILKEAGWPEDLSQDVPLSNLRTVTGKEVEDIREAVKKLLPR